MNKNTPAWNASVEFTIGQYLLSQSCTEALNVKPSIVRILFDKFSQHKPMPTQF